MDQVPKILELINNNLLLKTAIEEFRVDTSLLQKKTTNKNWIKIDTFDLGIQVVTNLTISTSIKRKGATVSFYIDNQDFYDNSDSYCLSNNFKKVDHWICNTKVAKHYCYMNATNLISITILNFQQPDGIYIRIDSTSYKQKLISEEDLLIIGALYLNDTASESEGSGEVFSRPATAEEISKLNINTNWELHKKYHDLKNQQSSEINDLERIEFFNKEKNIHILYCSKSIINKLKSGGVKSGKNEVNLSASVTYFDDKTLIINEIHKLQVKSTNYNNR